MKFCTNEYSKIQKKISVEETHLSRPIEIHVDWDSRFLSQPFDLGF